MDTSIVEALPHDMLVEILSRVGRQSCGQLFKAKTVCTSFFKASLDPLVYKRLCVDRFPIRWNDPKSQDLENRCFFNGNPNMVCRKGLKFYFDTKYRNLGLLLLKRASDMKVLEAVYTYGLLHFAMDPIESRDVGLEILNQAFPPFPDVVVPVRNRVFGVLGQFWLNNRKPFDDVTRRCPNRAHQGYEPIAGWELHYPPPECMACYWAYELGVFVDYFHYH